MYLKINNIKRITAPLTESEGGRMCPGIGGVGPPRVNEERVLNFELMDLLDHADSIMLKKDEEREKWIGVKGVMKRMRERFPYLITQDTCVELTFEEERHGLKYTCFGPYNYRQFTEALSSLSKLSMIHDHIVGTYQPAMLPGMKRETYRAEDQLLLLYSALRYELEHHEVHNSMLMPEDEEGAKAWEAEHNSCHHFGKNYSEKMQQNWVGLHTRLTKKKWLWGNEVGSDEWVYVCCGKRKAPEKHIVWHGPVGYLAHIVRKKFGGQWKVARNIFCLPEGKPLPESFETMHTPSQKAVEEINNMFTFH